MVNLAGPDIGRCGIGLQLGGVILMDVIGPVSRSGIIVVVAVVCMAEDSLGI